MASSFRDLIAVRETTPLCYESLSNAASMDKSGKRAYGGCTLAVALNSAYQTVLSKYHLYSVSGSFFGVALPDRKYSCAVRKIRDTKTFATRQIQVYQKLDNGDNRSVMLILADFHVKEPKSLSVFSAPPTKKYSSVKDSPSLDELREQLVKDGKITPQLIKLHKNFFMLKDRHFEQKNCPEGVLAQTFTGLMNHWKTSQDHLPLTSKTSADWLRTHEKLETQAQNLAAIIFIMDAMSFLAVCHDHKSLEDAGDMASLEMSFRVFSNDVQASNWHLREMRTITGGEGRTFNESRLWDEAGKMVAHMSQQCILRPRPSKTASL